MNGTDLVVVLPGIMGSTLGLKQHGRPAKDKLIWAATAGALWRGLTGLGPSIKDFPLPEGIGDDGAVDGVEPVGLMADVHAIPGLWTPIKGYSRLVRFLEGLGFVQGEGTANLLPVPYDWRLSNRYNGQRLVGIVEPALERWRAQGGPYADAQLVFVCHSMGGLVARWYIEKCGGGEITRKLITLGTPWRGAAKALTQLVNGVEKNIGPIELSLSAFCRSLPSTYQLLPEYACIESAGGWLKTTETSVPELSTAMLADAMAFHSVLQAAERVRPASAAMTHAIVGTRQPTWTTVRISGGKAVPLATFGTDNDYGDATVPLTGAIGHDEPMDTNVIRRIADQHGNLQRNQAAFDEVEEIITATPVRRRATKPVTLRVTAPDLVLTTEELSVAVDIDGGENHAVRIAVIDEAGLELDARMPKVRAGHAEAGFTHLPGGAHTITVGGPTPGSPLNPVTAATVVWSAGTGAG